MLLIKDSSINNTTSATSMVIIDDIIVVSKVRLSITLILQELTFTGTNMGHPLVLALIEQGCELYCMDSYYLTSTMRYEYL